MLVTLRYLSDTNAVLWEQPSGNAGYCMQCLKTIGTADLRVLWMHPDETGWGCVVPARDCLDWIDIWTDWHSASV